MNKPIINLDELEFSTFGKGEKFSAERAGVAEHIGARKLGYGVVRLNPGKRAWPYHSHHANEEFFYVLEGTGTLRHADEDFPIRAGDFICSPADPQQPHQIINTSDRTLSYITMSTMEQTDVFLYPDSNKFGVRHAPGGDRDAPGGFLIYAEDDAGVDYWHREADED